MHFTCAGHIDNAQQTLIIFTNVPKSVYFPNSRQHLPFLGKFLGEGGIDEMLEEVGAEEDCFCGD